MAFRRWFYKLSELRSLVPNKIPFMAVTATATRQENFLLVCQLIIDHRNKVTMAILQVTAWHDNCDAALISYFGYQEDYFLLITSMIASDCLELDVKKQTKVTFISYANLCCTLPDHERDK